MKSRTKTKEMVDPSLNQGLAPGRAARPGDFAARVFTARQFSARVFWARRFSARSPARARIPGRARFFPGPGRKSRPGPEFCPLLYFFVLLFLTQIIPKIAKNSNIFYDRFTSTFFRGSTYVTRSTEIQWSVFAFFYYNCIVRGCNHA